MELSEATQQQVLDAVAGGERIGDIAALLGTSERAVLRYRRSNAAFGKAFDLALVESVEADMLAIRDLARDEITADERDRAALGLADGKNVDVAARMRAREVQFRILAWYVARRAPHKYGDKLALDVSGKVDMRAVLLAADARLLALGERRAALTLPDVYTSPTAVSTAPCE